MENFIDEIIEKRKELNISRYRLAKLTGIKKETLQKIELKKVRNTYFSNVLKIAKVLDIDLNKFKEE